MCGKSPVDPHHVKTRGAGGSDLLAVPLCRVHHVEVGFRGSNTFQGDWDIVFSEIQLNLLVSYIEAGGRI